MFFSVIVTIYNMEQYIDRCLSSLLEQQYDKFEVIMIDDGSTDMSSKIALGYSMRDKRFRYVYQNNQGSNSAYNHGICLSKGDYILFLDSDDYIKGELFLGIEKIIKNYFPDIIEFPIVVNSSMDLNTDFKAKESIFYDKNGIRTLIFKNQLNTFSVSSKVIKKSILNTIEQPYFDMRAVGADTIFSSKLYTLADNLILYYGCFYCLEARLNSQSLKHKTCQENVNNFSSVLLRLIDNFTFYIKYSDDVPLPMWQYNFFLQYYKKLISILSKNKALRNKKDIRKIRLFLITKKHFIVGHRFNILFDVKYFSWAMFPFIYLRIKHLFNHSHF